MKTIEDLSGTPNANGTFTESVGVKGGVFYEHPESAGWFVNITLGYGGLKAKKSTVEVAVPLEGMLDLLYNAEPNIFPQLPNVVATPNSGNAPQNVVLSCSVANVNIHYTTDNSAPTANSAVYANAINMAAGTLKAIAVRAPGRWRASAVMSFVFS